MSDIFAGICFGVAISCLIAAGIIAVIEYEDEVRRLLKLFRRK